MTGPNDRGTPPGYEGYEGTWSGYRERKRGQFSQNPLNQGESAWLDKKISEGWFNKDVSPETRRAAREDFLRGMNYGHGDRPYQFDWREWRSEYKDREYPPGSFEPREPPEEAPEGETPEEYRQRTRDERRWNRQFDQQRKGKPVTPDGWDKNIQGKEYDPSTQGKRGSRGKGDYLSDDPFARFKDPSPGGSPFNPPPKPRRPRRPFKGKGSNFEPPTPPSLPGTE